MYQYLGLWKNRFFVSWAIFVVFSPKKPTFSQKRSCLWVQYRAIEISTWPQIFFETWYIVKMSQKNFQVHRIRSSKDICESTTPPLKIAFLGGGGLRVNTTIYRDPSQHGWCFFFHDWIGVTISRTLKKSIFWGHERFLAFSAHCRSDFLHEGPSVNWV